MGQLTPPKRTVDTDAPYSACELQKVPSKGGTGDVVGGAYRSVSAFTVNKWLPFATDIEAIASFGRVEIGEHETRVARASKILVSAAANSYLWARRSFLFLTRKFWWKCFLNC